MNLSEIKEQQAALVADAKSLIASAESEDRDLNDGESEKYNNIMADVHALEAKAQRCAELEAIESNLRQSRGRVTPPTAPELPKETKTRYSLLKAIQETVENGRPTGLEKEVSDELALKYGRSPRGFFMPMETYDLQTSDGTGAHPANTSSEMIELLRNKMLVNQLGARVMTGLSGQGSVSIPRQSGGGTAYWVGEASAVTTSTQAIDKVTLTPGTVGAFTDVSRKFLNEASIDAENFVRNDLATVLALEIDRAAINGDGTGAEPEGILQNSSVNSVAFGLASPTFAKVVDMETEVAVDNADVGSLSYLTNAAVRGDMKTIEKASNTAQFLWEAGNLVNGYNAFVSNQVPSNLSSGSTSGLSAMIFGNWNDLILGFWSGLDIVVDPYSLSTSGSVRIVLMQDLDIVIRHNESFCKAVDITTT